MQIIFRYFAADKFVRKEDGGAVRRRAATRKDTPFEADVRPSGGGREEAAEIKPQDLIRLIPSEGSFSGTFRASWPPLPFLIDDLFRWKCF